MRLKAPPFTREEWGMTQANTRRRALLLLTTMVLAIAMASGTAMAVPQLDQQQSSHNGELLIDKAYMQMFTAGKSGGLRDVGLYIGCCKDVSGNTGGTPPDDLHVEIVDPSGFGRIIYSYRPIPASSFSKTDGSMSWWLLGIPFPGPQLVAGKQYGIELWSNSTASSPYYLWGYNDPSGPSGGQGYSGGDLRYLDPDAFSWVSAGDDDATFQTYMTDDVAPETTIDSGPSGTVSDDAAIFYFSSNESGSTFECRLDSSNEDDWSECSSPWPYTGLSEGSHTFEVRATDSSGNTDPTPPSRTWTVDLPDPPHVTDTNPNNGDTGVARTTKPKVRFDTDLDLATVNTQNVKLQVYKAKLRKYVTVSSTPSYANKVITVTPTNALGSLKRYRVVLSTNITSSTDQNLERRFSFRFTTRR
jgi:hypothetical protein